MPAGLSLGPHREELTGHVEPVVDASVHADEALQVGLVLHVGVVQAGVQHDDGKRQDVAGVCTKKVGSFAYTGCFFALLFKLNTLPSTK